MKSSLSLSVKIIATMVMLCSVGGGGEITALLIMTKEKLNISYTYYVDSYMA